MISFPLGGMANSEVRTCHFDVQVSGGAAGLLLADDMESGAGLWNVSHASGSVDWQLSGVNPYSPVSAWLAQDITTSSDQYLTLNNSISLGDDALLSFWHNYDTEADWDGGVVEISANGSSWTDLGPDMFRNGYNSIINTNPASAISDRPAFSGSSGGYQQTLVDLSAHANKNIRVRFRMATDGFVGGVGWDLDDVELSNNAIIHSQACASSDQGDNECDQVRTPVAASDAPSIATSPTAIAATHFTGDSTEHNLTINNVGSATLDWDIGTGGGCTQPSWASANPVSGSTGANSGSNITVTLNSSGLSPDNYNGTLCISSNDSNNSPYAVDLSLTVNDPNGTVQQLASGETHVTGTVLSGNYTDTHYSDGSYQRLGESHQGGKPADRWDLLEHIWIFNLQNGTGLSFNAEANIVTSSNDGDEFLWFYSDDNNTWTPFYTLTVANSGDPISVSLPDASPGSFYIRVMTSDQTKTHNNPDELDVYVMTLTEGGVSNPPPALEMSLQSLTGQSYPGRRNRWDAEATATVVDSDGNPVSAAVVHASWSSGSNDSCTTNSSGQCTMQLKNIKTNVGAVTLQVTDITRSSGDTYVEGAVNNVNISAP